MLPLHEPPSIALYLLVSVHGGIGQFLGFSFFYYFFPLPCFSLSVRDPRAGMQRELPSDQGFTVWVSCSLHRKAAWNGFSDCGFLISAALRHLRNSFHN